ncbi:hypothetical protein [Nostoc sp. LPT]|uniref:hypothetical protein n=1 Tax=Nostoc sp. LPT TaxID=2815387 RepID=UPI001DF517AC|nr:hypothetical protein [Nostoc sp. LPT]MBN4000762.1 hypothetical protein [Nostoc sp. LPT]
MKPGNFLPLNPNFSKLNNWVNQISLKRLDIAYNAAVAIKEIEKSILTVKAFRPMQIKEKLLMIISEFSFSVSLLM